MPGFRTAIAPDQEIDTVVRGPMTTQDIAGARHTVGTALESVAPAQRARIKLAQYRTGMREPIAVAQINLDLSGRLVRSQAVAGAVAAAAEQAVAALVPRIHRLRNRLDISRTEPPSFADEPWDQRAALLAPHLRPAGRSRRLARRKAYPLAVQSVGAATFTMDLRDYDFHLFVDEETGQDAVVIRGGPAGYRLAADRPELLDHRSSGMAAESPAVVLPRLTLPEATRQLDAGDAGFLAFTAADSGRAAVLYARFDGHLALLTSLW
jgi:hypothetical protein